MRIRQASLEHYDKYEKTFGLKSFSNILSLPYPSLAARNMKIDQQEAMKKLDRQLLQGDVIIHPIIVSHITDPEYKNQPIKSLD